MTAQLLVSGEADLAVGIRTFWAERDVAGRRWSDEVCDTLERRREEWGVSYVVFGDDQYENFREDMIPPFCVFAVPEMVSRPLARASACAPTTPPAGLKTQPHRALVADLNAQLATARLGGPQRARARHAERASGVAVGERDQELAHRGHRAMRRARNVRVVVEAARDDRHTETEADAGH